MECLLFFGILFIGVAVVALLDHIMQYKCPKCGTPMQFTEYNKWYCDNCGHVEKI